MPMAKKSKDKKNRETSTSLKNLKRQGKNKKVSTNDNFIVVLV